ncbi:MAG: phosphonate ABC transporter ATP-binding protein [Pseudomonadota bacterium]
MAVNPTPVLRSEEKTPLINKASVAAQRFDLQVDGLTKAFKKGEPVVDRLAFSVARCESVALIGSNGAGKSTALRSALRLIEPDAGDVTLFDTALMQATPKDLRRIRADVGFVFQKHNLVPRLSALSNVVHGHLGRAGGVRGWSQAFAPPIIRDQALACLDRVGLIDHAMKRADQLSGGQSQRVAIARALMAKPKMIVADEPVASLDPVAGEEVMTLFAELVREEGITLLFTSHHVDHALAFSDRVLALKAGRLVLDAPSGDLQADELRVHYG